MFSIAYMVIAAGGVGTYIVGFVILFEWVCPEKRTFAATFAQIPFGIGFLYTIFLGYINSDWFVLQLVMAAPNIFFLIVYPFTPETPRYIHMRISHSKLQIFIVDGWSLLVRLIEL